MEPLTIELRNTLYKELPKQDSEITMGGPNVQFERWFYLRDETDVRIMEPLDKTHYRRSFHVKDYTFPGWFLFEVSEENWNVYGHLYSRADVVAYVQRLMDSIPSETV